MKYRSLDHDDDCRPKWKPKTPDEHRQEALQDLRLYLDDPDSVWAKAIKEKSEWTDEQWLAHDAEIEARVKAEEAEEERKRRDAHRSRLHRDGWSLRAIENADAVDETHPAIEFMKNWDPKKGNIVALSGLPGCGKTTAAAWTAVQNVGRECLFVRASTFARSSRFDRDTREKWLDADALVLDDIGAEFADSKGSFQTDLDELIDTYYGNRRPLVLTTNLTAAQFKARYGERVADRLRECGEWFQLSTGSLRKKAS